MRTSIELIKINLKIELNNPFLSDLKCTYLIQKIKLLNNHNERDARPRKILHSN